MHFNFNDNNDNEDKGNGNGYSEKGDLFQDNPMQPSRFSFASPNIAKGKIRPQHLSPPVLGTPLLQQQGKRPCQWHGYSPLPQLTDGTIELDINGIVVGETSSCKQSSSQLDKSSSELSSNRSSGHSSNTESRYKKVRRLLKEIITDDSNENTDDRQKTRVALMEYLLETPTKQNDRVTEVLELLGTTSKTTTQEKVVQDTGKYLCRRVDFADGTIKVRSMNLLPIKN